ncbi:MAG: PDZ domain-containing protein [Acidobacteria bacterium]|nr:PDZ domain-containing protein [Acidobacteriota bacterium]
MSFVNDQNPFDVTPDDERRPAVDAPQQTHEPFVAAPEAFPAPLAAPEAFRSPLAEDEADASRASKKHRRIAALSIAAAVIFTAGAGGGAAASLALARSTTTASASAGTGTPQQQGGSGSSNGLGTQGGFGGQGFGGQGFGGQGFGNRSGSGVGGFGSGSGSGTGSSTTSSATTATAGQVVGLVTVDTQLGYENGEAAGTGIILTSNGRILTNNHVIDGATAIKVTVQSTGRSYTAAVVGTDATKDIAVLQLQNASGLTVAHLATGVPSTGDAVTAIGNANGTGTLSAAAGTVSALDQTITTSSEGSTPGETLHGLIEINADVVPGDSGGAVENTNGGVIGVTTAASSGTAAVTGYAIPISTAMGVAKQIVAGDATSEITLGLPAFLGISLSADSSGAVVQQVLSGTPAAKTALAAGDTITKVGSTMISSSAELSAAIGKHAVGQTVTITFTDTAGATHTATVTLAAGPAD